MTWSKFLLALRSGVQTRVATIRAPHQQMNKSASTQSAVAAEENPPEEETTKKTWCWDTVVWDVRIPSFKYSIQE